MTSPAWSSGHGDLRADMDAARRAFDAAQSYTPNAIIVAPHSGERALIQPEHLLACAPCLDRYGLWRVRWAVEVVRYGGWTETTRAIWRALSPEQRRFPPVAPLPLP